MNKFKKEHGYTLIELLVATAIFCAVTAGILGLIIRAGQRTSIALENNQLEETKETLGSLIRPDFENAGYGIDSYQNHIFDIAGASFNQNEFYYPLPEGVIYRTGEGPGEPVVSTTQIGSETGWVSVKFGESGSITLSGENGNEIRLFTNAQRDLSHIQELMCYASNQKIDLGGYDQNSVYRISLTADPAGKAFVITKITGEQNEELLRMNDGVPAGIVSVSAYMPNNGDQMQIKIFGAPVIETKPTSSLQPTLFMDSNSQTAAASIYKTADTNEVTIIGGDSRTGIGYLKQDAGDLTSNKTIRIGKLQKGNLSSADYCLLINYEARTSVLLQVDDAADYDPETLELTVHPVTEEGPAWQRFYSSDDEVSNGTYPTGSRLVKLAEPVTYRITSDNRLVRQAGIRPETVAFNVQTFNFTPIATDDGTQFKIQVELKSDGRNTASDNASAPIVKYEYTATPRALNVANQSE